MLALAQALIEHLERTLDGDQIDKVIVQTLASEALAAEHAPRAEWRNLIERVASPQEFRFRG